MWPATAIKMDILAAFRYMDVFLSQWLAGQLSDIRWEEESGNHVSGLTAAFYKDMGNAKALLNLSEIALPRWMTVKNIEQGKHYQNVLEEHQQIVSSLEERYAEAVQFISQLSRLSIWSESGYVLQILWRLQYFADVSYSARAVGASILNKQSGGSNHEP